MPITTAGWTTPARSVAGGIVERHRVPVVHYWPDVVFTRAATAPVRLVVPGPGSTGWVFHSGWFQVEQTHPVGGPVQVTTALADRRCP